MITIFLKPGEAVDIQFAESDGSIRVKFDEDAIRVQTDWEDSSGRVGTIYEEKFISDYDLARMPIGKCNKCHRAIWKKETIGEIDLFGDCGGKFIPFPWTANCLT
jgi:hypothetical protein